MTAAQLLDRAQIGDAQAQFVLGSRYQRGAGVPLDLGEAFRWLKEAASQGHVGAQFNLGHLYSSGEGINPDPAEAIKWYLLAAEQGRPEAQNNLALMYDKAQHFQEAARWFQRAADQGYVGAQASLGFAYSQGRGVPVNEGEAFRYYSLAAEQGYAPAQSNLGALYAQGRGAPLDPVEAAHWTRRAAEQGFGKAEGILGDFYAEGFGVPADESEAVKWFLRAAAHGEAVAQNNLAIRYATGNGVAADLVRAYMWFSAAAAQGHPDAIQNRDKVPLERTGELYELISAAASGNVESQRNLAYQLHHGQGIDPDADAARYWLQRAADGGDAWAQTTYALKLGNSDDPDVAREQVWWLTKAADQGDDRALFNLGLRQFMGVGTASDHETAAINVLRASLAGFDEARTFMKDVMRAHIPEDWWPSIFGRLRWPDLVFIMGPLAEGHLDGIRKSQENDDGSDDAEWLKYERSSANTWFLGSANGKGSVLDTVFGEPVSVKKIFVGRAMIDGKVLASVSISLQDILLEDGFPVHWKPTEESLKAIVGLIGLMDGRTWMRHFYSNF